VGCEGWMWLPTRGVVCCSVLAQYAEEKVQVKDQHLQKQYIIVHYKHKPNIFWTTYVFIMPLGLHQTTPLARNRDERLLFARRIDLWIIRINKRKQMYTFRASHLCRDPVPFAAIEWLGEELHVGIVSRLWTLDLHRTAELNPRHRKNRPW